MGSISIKPGKNEAWLGFFVAGSAAAGFIFYSISLSMIPSSLASVIYSPFQIITVILVSIFFGETVSLQEWIFIILILAGISLMGV